MRPFLLVLMVCSLGCLAVAPAAAAPSADDLVNGTATPENRVSIQLNDLVTVTDWTYQNGEFRITVEAEVPTDLVVSDSMRVKQALEHSSGSRSARIPRRSYNLEQGTQTIIFDGTQYQGEAAVSVTVRGGSYLLYTGSTSGAWSGPWTTRHLQIAALSAALSVALVILYKTFRHFTGRSFEPERVA